MNPTRSATIHHCNSRRIAAPLTTAILKQEKAFSQDINSDQLVIKQRVKTERRRLLAGEASRLHEVLPPKLQRAMDLGREKGTSSWLVTLPIEEHNFALTLWSDTTSPTLTLCLWLYLLHGACAKLPLWRTTLHMTQQHQRFHSKTADRGLPQCGN